MFQAAARHFARRTRSLILSTAVCAAAGIGWVTATLADAAPKPLSCTFSSGTTQTFENGRFQRSDAKELVFAIEDIDLAAQKAKVRISETARGNLSIVRAINANHYIEPVNEGFLNLTTVYDKDQATGKYPAVHSRHFGLIGQPVISQYTGFCTDQ